MGSDDLARRRARQLAAEAAASGDPAGWFEMLYAEAQSGSAAVPWDDRQANPHLAEWAAGAAERAVVRPGRQALVVGCGVCDDPVFDPAMMPWPLTRRELEAMAGNQLTARSIEKFLDDEDPPKLRWRAEFGRRVAG